MAELTRREVERGGRVVVYTNRKTLRNQISEVLESFNIWHGVRSAGYKANLNRPVQVSSIMTERSRVLEKEFWPLHDASLVIVDEQHIVKADVAKEIQRRHLSQGATYTGWTATPVGIGHMVDHLVQMSKPSELLSQGVLVPCEVYAPEELDMSGVAVSRGDYVHTQMRQRVRDTLVVGNIIDHWLRLNPSMTRTVLFAPGVPESRWIAEEFNRAGFSAGHVDANTSERQREDLFWAWREGEIQVVCNFGILREGFDLRECGHAILVQPTKKISTYLQMVGRVVRSCDEKEVAVLQDHVGAYWMHGDPNEDRRWGISDTDQSIARKRKKKPPGEDNEDHEPYVCPNCGAVMFDIPGFEGRCVKCGYEHEPVLRMIRQTDGKLKLVKKKRKRQPDFKDYLYPAIYWGVKHGKSAGTVLMIACRRGKCGVDRSQVNFFIPTPLDKEWRLPAAVVWPWATRRK